MFIRLVIIAISFTSLNATHLKWYGDYEKALIVAKKEKKPIMLFLQQKDCLPCQKMLKTTLNNQPYINKLNDLFICIIVNREDKISYPIELFYTQTYPTIFFIDFSDESYIQQPIFGYIKPSIFKNKIK